MTQWYVSELSRLTSLSVQTLHHYDRMDLLKPSVRLANGYRLYSEADLLKLQQIIALKFFGFELAHIKTLLGGHVDMVDHFALQARLLDEKAMALREASQTLHQIVSQAKIDQVTPSWETILQLIEVYRMTKELEKTWAGSVLTPDELKQYAHFEADLKNKSTEKEVFEKEWAHWVCEIEKNLDQDPKGERGVSIAKPLMALINGLYGKEHAELKRVIWEKGFKAGNTSGKQPVSQEVIAWMDQAIGAYYRGRIYALLDSVLDETDVAPLPAWSQLMEEMYGDAIQPKNELIQVALNEDRVSPLAKKWLVHHFK